MKKEQIQQWCKENGYALVDINRYDLEPEYVMDVAMKATFIYKIDEHIRDQEVAFARFLAASYLDDKMATGVLSKRLGVSHGIISHARKMNLLTEDPRYLKPWQQNSLAYFKDKIKLAESKIKCKYS